MNTYGTLAQVKADLVITGTSEDSNLLRYLESASRAIDRYCARWFYVQSAARFQTAVEVGRKRQILLDADLLSVSAFAADTENDGTYDGESWVESTDYWLTPYNGWPKLTVEETGFGNYFLALTDRLYKLTGQWGYGDGESATPYTASGLTGTVASAGGTTITASADASTTIYAGHTLLIGSEQVYVTAVSGTSITVKRGMNGTTATSHSAVAMNIYRYPADVQQFAVWMAGSEFKDRGKGEMSQERMGDYFYTRMVNGVDKKLLRVLGPYRRWF